MKIAVITLLALTVSGCAAQTIQDAARSHQNDRIVELIQRGDDVNSHDGKEGKTALHWAADVGDLRCTKTLLDKGAEVDAKDVYTWTPLVWAVYRSQIFRDDPHLTIITCLLDKEAKIDAADKDGYTALHYAAYYGKIRAVEILIARGANVNAKTNAEQTPLSMAVAYHFDNVADLLRKNGGK